MKKKIELDDFRNNGKKKKLRRDFWEVSDEFDLYIDILLIFYVFCAKIFFFFLFAQVAGAVEYTGCFSAEG